MRQKIGAIRKLVGRVTEEQLRYVDCFAGEHIGLFMPVGGACFYALTPEHSHPAYMFLLHFDDRTSMKLGGKTITARHGKIFALPPGIAHQELPSDSPSRYIAILIEEVFFNKQLSLYPADPAIPIGGEFYDAASDLLPLLNKFMIEADNEMPGSEEVLHALAVEIAHVLIRGMAGCTPAHDRMSARVEIGRAVEYMHTNIGRKIVIDELAKAACMSPSHFSRVFKTETGKSPLDYLNGVRMERAKKLLKAGDKSITEIALECGFGSPAYLSASFRKEFKITPSGFRQALKKGGISKKERRIVKD